MGGEKEKADRQEKGTNPEDQISQSDATPYQPDESS